MRPLACTRTCWPVGTSGGPTDGFAPTASSGASGDAGELALAAGWEALTPTEVNIAALVARGNSTSDIARGMFLSRRTVQTYISHILAKLGAKSRVEIVRMAMLQAVLHLYVERPTWGTSPTARVTRDEAAETSEARPLDPSLMTGWKELTDAERTVAELVARGMTNKQAGRRMFSSHHTVDTHLRRVFREARAARAGG